MRYSELLQLRPEGQTFSDTHRYHQYPAPARVSKSINVVPANA